MDFLHTLGKKLFVIGQQNLLIMVNYWSTFFKVVETHRKTAQALITQFKVQFAHHGIPEVLISDNSPEFGNGKFKNFSSEWQFAH